MHLQNNENSSTYAAIDLGSNSFHLAIGQMTQGELRWQFKLSEKVQLAFGIDENHCLNAETTAKAIECLELFYKRISYIQPENIRIVGTNALRVIRNGDELLRNVERIFNQRVEVISGREEARLIYLGVSHTSPNNKHSKLVIDIGGGSTEFIIGQQFQPILTESLHMGCITYKKLYFADNRLTLNHFKQAIAASEQEVQHISRQYQTQGWTHALGASGSVKSVFNALKGLDQPREFITLKDLQWLMDYLIQQGSIDNICIPQLKPERYPIFPSGVAILYGAMKQLEIEKLYYSEGALREGMIYDLLGRNLPENVRERTRIALQDRFSIDVKQAERVEKTNRYLLSQLAGSWKEINHPHLKSLLDMASHLHEIGLTISHTQFHKHGAYILTFADLAGFSRQEQAILGCLVRPHRRKFAMDAFQGISESNRPAIKYLAIILRLGVLLHHSRNQTVAELTQYVQVKHDQIHENGLTLVINSHWLQKNPLILEDLVSETKQLKKIHFELKIVQD